MRDVYSGVLGERFEVRWAPLDLLGRPACRFRTLHGPHCCSSRTQIESTAGSKPSFLSAHRQDTLFHHECLALSFFALRALLPVAVAVAAALPALCARILDRHPVDVFVSTFSHGMASQVPMDPKRDVQMSEMLPRMRPYCPCETMDSEVLRRCGVSSYVCFAPSLH